MNMNAQARQAPRVDYVDRSVVRRCGECMKEMHEADRGFGSTAWACPDHGFYGRPIVEVPKSLEEEARRHPELVARWVRRVVPNAYTEPDSVESERESGEGSL